MLVINFNGRKPIQRNYDFYVVGDSRSNTIRFAIQRDIGSQNIETLDSDFACYVKLQSAGKEYIDKILIENKYIENGILFVNLSLTKKMTHWKNLALQVQFENGEGEFFKVVQTEIVNITMHGTIDADKEISEEYPEAIQQLEGKVIGFDKRIKDCEEKVEKAKEILIDNPDDYLNENGLDKIIRPMGDNGNVNKSYMIDKKFIPNTLIVCEQHREENGYVYCDDNENDITPLIDDLGRESLTEIFGNYAPLFESEGNGYVVSSLYYNQDEEITKGVLFSSGSRVEYVGISINECKPNKIVRLIVGKYFEYNEQGEKVFDEKSALFSNNFIDEDGSLLSISKEITEERQVFELRTDDNGYFYFDSDSGSFEIENNRFILYGIECGEPEHSIYEKKELGSGSGGKKKRPLFVRRITKDNDGKMLFESDCRLAVNTNLRKYSKKNLGNWFNTSKGNAICDYVCNAQTTTIYDFICALFGDNPSYSGRWKDHQNPAHPDGHYIRLKSFGDRPKVIFCYDFDSANIHLNNISAVRILRQIAKKSDRYFRHGQNGFIVSNVVNIRFIRNFEWKDGDTAKGWNGEMNSWELQLLLFRKYNKSGGNNIDDLYIVPTWKQI